MNYLQLRERLRFLTDKNKEVLDYTIDKIGVTVKEELEQLNKMNINELNSNVIYNDVIGIGLDDKKKMLLIIRECEYNTNEIIGELM